MRRDENGVVIRDPMYWHDGHLNPRRLTCDNSPMYGSIIFASPETPNEFVKKCCRTKGQTGRVRLLNTWVDYHIAQRELTRRRNKYADSPEKPFLFCEMCGNISPLDDKFFEGWHTMEKGLRWKSLYMDRGKLLCTRCFVHYGGCCR